MRTVNSRPGRTAEQPGNTIPEHIPFALCWPPFTEHKTLSSHNFSNILHNTLRMNCSEPVRSYTATHSNEIPTIGNILNQNSRLSPSFPFSFPASARTREDLRTRIVQVLDSIEDIDFDDDEEQEEQEETLPPPAKPAATKTSTSESPRRKQ